MATKYPNLSHYLENKNKFALLFNKKKDYPSNPEELSNENVMSLKSCIECELSPENLHCDGEISHKMAKKKATYLNNVANELAKATGISFNLQY